MDTTRLGRQTDLFSPQADLFDAGSGAGPGEAPPEDFVARIRGELRGTLALVQAAAALPWPDLTRATLEELRFRSVAGWLPAGEAKALRAAFDTEMQRLYEAADATANV